MVDRETIIASHLVARHEILVVHPEILVALPSILNSPAVVLTLVLVAHPS